MRGSEEKGKGVKMGEISNTINNKKYIEKEEKKEASVDLILVWR